MIQYLLGFDIGSSSVKASLVNVTTGGSVATAQSPQEEMIMIAKHPGWAEQDPEMWWEHVVKSCQTCVKKSGATPDQIIAIGITYQMHGLVVVDKAHKPLRPAIIWCDSRAVEIGEKAFKDLHKEYCLKHFLNSPGNFTASKLNWVRENEPDLFSKIYKIMLPGDYIALKLTGEATTTNTGLSEGILWDYTLDDIASLLMHYYKIDSELLSTRVPVFSIQGKLREKAAKELGLSAGTMVSYRAGDQPNNAFSLNVINPGETCATAGTSGVIYSVTDKRAADSKSRVNTFVHVNDKYAGSAIRNGILLCVNGTGILNSWLRKTLSGNGSPYDYDQINAIAAQAPIGSNNLMVFPFGNGAERILQNKEISSTFFNLNFNQHTQAHVFRAAQEGIVFALKYGFDILRTMGIQSQVIRACHTNLFLSPIFRDAFVNTTGVRLELYETDGATGAALGAGLGSGAYNTFNETFKGLKLIRYVEPDPMKMEQYNSFYDRWKAKLEKQL